MIEMEQIKKSFMVGGKSVDVLKGISLFIGRGEFVSIMGPSGSGKSTLSSILGCLASSSSGTYRIDGLDVGTLGKREIAKLRNERIGFIFQDFNLLEGITAVDNVSLPLLYRGMGPKERRDRARETLKSVGLEGKVASLPSQLSGGQKQRVAIARALVNEPKFLFADEPTGALDKKTGYQIMGLIQKLNLMGHTVVQVTHSAHDSNFSKRVLHLVDGLIVKDELVERPILGTLNSNEGEGREIADRLWRVAQVAAVKVEDFSALKTLLASSKSHYAIMEAIGALRRFDLAEAKKLVFDFLEHDYWGVRTEVLRSLPIGSDRVQVLLDRGLEDPNPWVRFTALLEIRKTRDAILSVEQKTKILSHIKDADERVRATAVALASFWKNVQCVPHFTAALDDADGRVRANALDALAPMLLSKSAGDAVFKKCMGLLTDKNNRARANAAVYLFSYAPLDCFDCLSKMLLSENNLMRASSAWALGKISDPRAGSLLLQALRIEGEPLVVNQLIGSLGKLAEGDFSIQEQIRVGLGSVEPYSEVVESKLVA